MRWALVSFSPNRDWLEDECGRRTDGQTSDGHRKVRFETTTAGENHKSIWQSRQKWHLIDSLVGPRARTISDILNFGLSKWKGIWCANRI